jgi:hypothetical protein
MVMGQEHNLSKQLQLPGLVEQLKDPEPVDVTKTWATEGSKNWHASERPVLSNAVNNPIHSGTAFSASDRASDPEMHRPYFHPVEISGNSFTPSDMGINNANGGAAASGTEWSDAFINRDAPYSTVSPEEHITERALREGGNNIPYRNIYEDPGSTSMMSPRKNVKTWSEGILSNWFTTATRPERKAVQEGWDLAYRSPDIEGYKDEVESIYGGDPYGEEESVSLFPERGTASPEGLTASNVKLDNSNRVDQHGMRSIETTSLEPEWVPPKKAFKKKSEPEPQLPGLED